MDVNGFSYFSFLHFPRSLSGMYMLMLYYNNYFCIIIIILLTNFCVNVITLNYFVLQMKGVTMITNNSG